MTIEIPMNLYIEVDDSKRHCLSEPVHCHILRDGRRVAKVEQLEPVIFEFGHSLGTGEIFTVFDAISKYKKYIEEKYEYNRLYGTD